MKRQLTGIALVAALCLTGVATAGPAFAEGASTGDLTAESVTPAPVEDSTAAPQLVEDVPATAANTVANPAAIGVRILTKKISRPASSCKDAFVKISVSGLPSGVTASASATMKRGGKSISVYGKVVGNGVSSVNPYPCASADAGNYRTNVVVRYWNGSSYSQKSVSSYVLVKGKPAFYGLNITGKAKANAKKRVTGYVNTVSDLRGKTVKVYFKANGKSKYKYLGKSGKVNSKGKFSFVSKKLGKGRLYVASGSSQYLYPAKSPVMKIVVR